VAEGRRGSGEAAVGGWENWLVAEGRQGSGEASDGGGEATGEIRPRERRLRTAVPRSVVGGGGRCDCVSRTWNGTGQREGRVSGQGYLCVCFSSFSTRETNAPTKMSAGRTKVPCKCWRPCSDIFSIIPLGV
jgi:hypothetical protein